MYIAVYNFEMLQSNTKGVDNMGAKYTEAQKKAILKYQENKVKIQITLTPDQRERYHAFAESQGISLTKLIIDLLEKEINK